MKVTNLRHSNTDTNKLNTGKTETKSKFVDTHDDPH